MNFGDIIRTCFEFVLVSFTVWAVFHEDRFIRLEDRLFAYIKRKKLKVIKVKANKDITFDFQHQ